MRRIAGAACALLVATTLAARAEAPASEHITADERADPATATLDEVDWLVLIDMRKGGDKPACARRYDHILDEPEPGTGDRAGLVAALEALEGWEIDPYPGEAVYPFATGPGTAQELARQLRLLDETAAQFGFRHNGWSAETKLGC